MKRLINSSVAILFLIVILGGCAPKRVSLRYQPSIKIENISHNKKIGIFTFIDDRDMPPKAYGTMVKLIIGDLPIAFYSHQETETSITDYITSSFKIELKNLGFQVVDDNSIYSKAISLKEFQSQVNKLNVEEADKIIIGRIRFFRWTQAGFAGALFQGMMPKPRLNTEIQVMVIDPKSMKILWAGSGCASEKSTENVPKAEEIENKIILALNQAFTQIITNKGFLNVLI